jgi:hypothetical protein
MSSKRKDGLYTSSHRKRYKSVVPIEFGDALRIRNDAQQRLAELPEIEMTTARDLEEYREAEFWYNLESEEHAIRKVVRNDPDLHEHDALDKARQNFQYHQWVRDKKRANLSELWDIAAADESTRNRPIVETKVLYPSLKPHISSLSVARANLKRSPLFERHFPNSKRASRPLLKGVDN